MGLGAKFRQAVPGASPTVLRWEKLFFAAVGLSALWIGFWGYFLPAIQKSIPFPIPALHARFLGAMYLSAFVMLLGGYRADRWGRIGVVPVMTSIWTGGIFVVSLIHIELFDFSTPQTWIWMVAYGVYPLIALWLVWIHRDHLTGNAGEPAVSRGIALYLTIQGAVLALLAAALFLAPEAMVARWPWPITDSLAQLYAAPFLSYAVGSLLLSRTAGWPALRIGLVTMAVFAAGVLIASLLHRDLFSASELPDQLWFGLFALGTAALALLTMRSLRDG